MTCQSSQWIEALSMKVSTGGNSSERRRQSPDTSSQRRRMPLSQFTGRTKRVRRSFCILGAPLSSENLPPPISLWPHSTSQASKAVFDRSKCRCHDGHRHGDDGGGDSDDHLRVANGCRSPCREWIQGRIVQQSCFLEGPVQMVAL